MKRDKKTLFQMYRRQCIIPSTKLSKTINRTHIGCNTDRKEFRKIKLEGNFKSFLRPVLTCVTMTMTSFIIIIPNMISSIGNRPIQDGIDIGLSLFVHVIFTFQNNMKPIMHLKICDDINKEFQLPSLNPTLITNA